MLYNILYCKNTRKSQNDIEMTSVVFTKIHNFVLKLL